MIKRRSKVRVVNFGHILYQGKKSKFMVDMMTKSYKVYKETDEWVMIDVAPFLVGQEGVVVDIKSTNNKKRYAVKGLTHWGKDLSKTAWFSEDQLEEI